jgi:hypothetical protein
MRINGAKQFYERFDFFPSLSDPLHLFIFLKDIRKRLACGLGILLMHRAKNPEADRSDS